MQFTFPNNPVTEIQFKSILLEIHNNIYAIIELTRNNILSEREKNTANPQYTPNPNTMQICAGLFTYAIEEFGKYKLLEECEPRGGMVNLAPIRNRFFDHDEKFKIARENLHDACFIIYDRSDEDEQWSDIILDIPFPMGWVDSVEADFATRLDIFNVGIQNNGDVRPSPTINFNDLESAVEYFYNEFLNL